MPTPSYEELNGDYPHFPTLEDLGEMEGEIGGFLNQAQELDELCAEMEEIPELDGLLYARVSSAIAGTSTIAADEAYSQGMMTGTWIWMITRRNVSGLTGWRSGFNLIQKKRNVSDQVGKYHAQ